MKNEAIAILIVILAFSYCAPRRASVSPVKPGSGESFSASLAQGIRLLEDKKYGDAIGELKRATVLKPDSARAFNYLGIAYFMRNNLDEARACFQKALEINPDYAAAHCNLGDLQFKEGKADLAVDTLSKALAAIGDNVMLHFTLGNILLHKGEIDEGFAHLGKVMDLDPGYLDRERGFAVEASESNLPQPEMFFRYACLYAANGNLGKTLEFLEKARKAGFSEWKRILHDDAFARFRDDPQIKKYIE